MDDSFFDSLKSDYPGNPSSTGFKDWFKKKSDQGNTALVFEDKIGVGAFVVLKMEDEEIELQCSTLSKKKRIKISTFRVSERYRRQRIGEGAIGLLLWRWQRSDCSEVYVTVFDKHDALIAQFERFGFERCGKNLNGESVLVKCREQIDFSDPYKAFPFIKSGFKYAGYIIIDDNFHDTMFAYSELANNSSLQAQIRGSVSNGLSKIYVGAAQTLHYIVGEPVLIYRRFTQGKGKRYRSCITSFCVITDVIQAKIDNQYIMSFDELKKRVSNKSVFSESELQNKYNDYRNVTVIELLYYGYFGAGNNVNMDWLDRNGCWTKVQYPTEIQLTEEQFKKVLTGGRINVQDVIVN